MRSISGVLSLAVLIAALGGVSSAQTPNTQNTVAKFDGNGQVTDSSIFDNGNVGIGTTTPSAKLEVSGGVRATGGPNPNAPGSGTGVEIGWDGAQGVVQVYDRTNGAGKPLWLNYGSGNTILGGNVGIGTTSPSYLLHIQGNQVGLNIENTNVSYGAGTSLVFGHAQGGSTIPQARIYSFLTNGDGAGYRAGQLRFQTAGSGVLQDRMTIMDTGNIGIGTTAPSELLHAKAPYWSNMKIESGTAGYGAGVVFTDPQTSYSIGVRSDVYGAGNHNFTLMQGTNALMTVQNGTGNVGIGTTTPVTRLDVQNGTIRVVHQSGAPELLIGDGGGANASRADIRLVDSPSAPKALLLWGGDSTNGYQMGQFTVNAISSTFSGNVGIGTPSPSAKLEVNGGLRFSGDTAGTVQTTAWTGVLCGGDYAESVDVTGERKKYEPGDVLVLDPEHPGSFVKSAEPYSTSVAGIYSSKPGVVGRRSTDATKQPDEVPMAMVGIVPTKVSAENGPIRTGDLLVTSGTTGYAMKGTDHSRMLGAVVGKAMGRLDEGTGIIEVLVTLQ